MRTLLDGIPLAQMNTSMTINAPAMWLLALYAIAALALFIPTLAAGVRRLHDRGRSGWNWLWALIPFGGIVVLVWLAQDSTPGLNQYN
jgi:uncharacterized membrane protein YhaH (DUF805 family)